ncbi:MAG TPA: acyl-CoA thioester hydrolase/BAAT C-terminal domain-containing protein [Chitinophagaceae bacterium]|nr:acyl-CoA thioester hydrolase/BAAT C-terminal domain-containing protein [Chitinophagaceae bacterium]
MKVVCWCCLLLSQFAFGQFEKLKPNQTGCGFISLTRFDTSRLPVKEQPSSAKGRIIQINIWYPIIEKSAGHRMHFGDYVDLVGKELDSTQSDFQKIGFDKYFAWPISQGADPNSIRDFLARKIPMQAVYNAKWDDRSRPLISLVHGFVADYAYLAEYLAGNGYIVMQVPVKGSAAYDLDYEGKGLESQVQDYEFAWDIIRKEFGINAREAGIIGFSFGGQSAMALSIRNKQIRAVISLDGGMGSAFGAGLLSRQSYYTLKDFDRPILHLYNPADQYTDLSWFDQPIKSHRVQASMKNMQHGHFTSFGLLNRYVPGIMGKEFEDPRNAYEAVMITTKKFLDIYLKDNRQTPAQFFRDLLATHSWTKEYFVKLNFRNGKNIE